MRRTGFRCCRRRFKQNGFIHRASQTKHLPRQALLGKSTIENNAVGADQRNKNDVRLCGTNPRKVRAVIVLAEPDEFFTDDASACPGDIFLGRPVGKPRPDVVAADQVPARRFLDIRQPLDGGARLSPRRFADRHHARRSLSTLIDWRVNIGNTARDDFPKRNPDGADVGSNNDIRIAGRDHLGCGPDHILDVAPGIMEDDLDFTSQDAATLVDLRDRQQRAIGGGRPPDPRRTAHPNEVGDPELLSIATPPKRIRSRRQG